MNVTELRKQVVMEKIDEKVESNYRLVKTFDEKETSRAGELKIYKRRE